MIPILYESTERVFATNGLGRLSDCTRCIVTEERNGAFVCEFDYPVSGRHFDEITLGRIIFVSSGEDADGEPFDIVSATKPINGIVTFTAEHVSYRLKGFVVNPISAFPNRSASAALGILEAADIPEAVPFAFTTDKTTTSSNFQTVVPMSVRSLMGGVEGSIIDVYGGEWEFYHWNCQLWESRGVDNGVRIRYGVNMSDYNQEISASECYDGVVPYWYNEDPDDGGAKLVQGVAVYGSSTPPGGRHVVVPLDVSDQFESRPTASQLLAAGRSHLSTDKPFQPEDSITVDFVQLWQTEEFARYAELLKCHLCDTVHVDFPAYGIEDLQTKVVAVEWDALTERYNSMTLGTISSTFADAVTEAAVSDIAALKTRVDQIRPVIYKDYALMEPNISAGSIGTYALQQTIDIQLSGYTPIAATPIVIAHPGTYDLTVAFNSGLTALSVTYARRLASAFTGSSNNSYRVVYQRSGD